MKACPYGTPRKRLLPWVAAGGWATLLMLSACGGGDAADAASGISPAHLEVRVQGLALGAELELAHGTQRVSAELNGPYTFSQVPAGTPLDLRVASQPNGQNCTVSELAPATVAPDGAPVFVRCLHTTATPLSLPATLPNNALSTSFGLRDVAYPGIPYESRPGLVGGIFPYAFRIVSLTLDGVAQATTGVALDARRGTVRFTPAVEGSYVLTLEASDSGSPTKTLPQSFTIESSAARFLFVAPDGQDSSGRGSRALPYRSIAYAQAQSSANQVLMLRAGTYTSATIHLRDTRAKQILAYPDEVVRLDLNYSANITVNSASLPMARIEGLDILHARQYGIVSDPSRAGLVIRNVRFVDGEEGNNPSENPAFIHGWGDTAAAWRHKLLVQDNDFGTYRMKSSGAYALTLFDAGESLVENNQIRLGATTGAIHDKDNSQNNTYRENYISFTANNARSNGIQISGQANADKVHIHHNLLVNAGIYLGTQCFQASCYMRDLDVHHNTLAGQHISFSWGPFNASSYGTRVSHNIIDADAVAPYFGLSCQASVPATFTTHLSVGSNLIASRHALAFKDSECTGRDMSWATWQGTYGMDTAVSGSAYGGTSPLVSSGPRTGLPVGDTRRTQRGHQY